ncbi:MAG: hypothetical protein HY508_07735 [Acidobacteria bacterium]|nr:hypothetical protein [Acidobacteriota bacterium]
MSDRLRKQICVELEQLDQLFEIHQPLLAKAKHTAPSDIELSALAAFLHSFYTGVENIFKRVATELDGQSPSGDSWHRDLLDAMTSETPQRCRFISPEMRDRLMDFLQFRHFFRHAYVLQLHWLKMQAVVNDCHDAYRALRSEIEKFLSALPRAG